LQKARFSEIRREDVEAPRRLVPGARLTKPG
jgi:hypothetical protein